MSLLNHLPGNAELLYEMPFARDQVQQVDSWCHPVYFQFYLLSSFYGL